MKRFKAIAGCTLVFIASTSFNAKKSSDFLYYLVVDKSKYELSVIDSEGWLVTYPVVFGNKDLDDKMTDGDRETPEGIYTLTGKNTHDKWDKILMTDYPTKADSIKFFKRKEQGLIPSDAIMGKGISIHGTEPGKDAMVDNYVNWTDGSISMRNRDLEELYNLVPVGSKVFIRK